MKSKALVIFTSGRIGDALSITPGLREFCDKYSSLEVTILGHRSTRWLYYGIPGVIKVDSLSRRKSIWKWIKYWGNFDVCFVLPSVSESSSPKHYVKFASKVSKSVVIVGDEKCAHIPNRNVKICDPYQPGERITEFYLRIFLPGQKKQN